MFEDVPIKYFAGSHRIKAPKETIEATESKLRVAGITRLTEITHLDRVGIPVFSAIRPTAQEGSVSIYAGTLTKNWKRKANLDLWSRLDKAMKKHLDVQLEWVKGHANDQFNEEADKLAFNASKQIS